MKPAWRLLAVSALAAASLFGQATSQIQGIITDPTGSAVVEAEVTATQTGTGFERTVSSGPSGTYVLANLPIGPYQIAAAKPDFTTAVQKGIVLEVASNKTVNITLQVGAVSETIEVVADASLVETRTPSIGGVLENKRILELPLNGRNPVELIQLAGAAVPGGKNTTSGFPGGLNIAVAGGQLSGVGYQLDGTMYNNLFDAVNLPFPFPDALQEFKVETSTMTAQNGTHASAAVSASIKSGTNQIHGSVFEFFRNGNMNAKNYFAARRDTLKRNQFGGTIGGPILKNQLFFFAAYQGTRTRSDPVDQPGNVPTAQMLAGDFSGCPDFGIIRDPAGGTFVGSQIPVSRFSPQALKAVDYLPKSADPCGRVSFGPIIHSNEHQVLGRVDYTIDSKHQLFGRYMATTYAQPPPYGLSGNVLDTGSPGIDDLAQTAALGYTYVASSNVVNQFRLAGNRVGVLRFNEDYFSGCDLGVIMHCYVPHQTILNVTGGFNIGSPPATYATFIPTYLTLSDDVTVVRGSHTLAFGYSSFKYQHSQQFNVSATVQFGFNGRFTGSGTTDFMLGQLGSMRQATPSTVFTNKWGHGLYAQDTWKISPRLTLTYGLRWEPFLPQALNNGAVYNFSLDSFKAGVRSQVVRNAPPGLLYAGDPGFHGKTGVNKRWNQFAPRIGIAFDPRGNGMTSIRASAGIAYDFPNLQIMSTPASGPPFASRVDTNGPSFSNPYANFPGGNPFPRETGVDGTFVPFGTFVAQQPDAKGPTTYTWNFSMQHQMGRDWMVSASYLGSQSPHLWLSRQLNTAILVPGPIAAMCPQSPVANCNAVNNTNQRRAAYLAAPAAAATLGPVDMFESGGNSNYHGLILTTQKRLSRGVSFNANYTWSHCIGDVPIGSGVGGIGGSYTDVNDRRRDRGNCSMPTGDEQALAVDRRHIFNFTTVLESPRFQDRALNHIASNWRLSASYRFLSASYLSVTAGSDVALTGAVGQRANQLAEDVFCKPRNHNCWISPAAFALPTAGTLGNAGRSNVAGPGFYGIDMAVSRIFRVRESISLEARGEAFNLTNGVRLNAPITARNNGNFGTIRTAQDPRIMQVALKLMF
jgi:hypothetical protein